MNMPQISWIVFQIFALPASEGFNFWLKKLTSTRQTSSPDLVPYDFLLFLKQTLDDKGKKISDISTIQAELYAAFAKFETWLSGKTGLTTLKKLLSRGQHWCEGLFYVLLWRNRFRNYFVTPCMQ